MTMHGKRFLLLLSFALVLVGAASASYYIGRRDVLVGEFKIYHGNLIVSEVSGGASRSAEVRELLKARYYYLGNRIPMSWLRHSARDYGPVDHSGIIGLSIGKGPTTPAEEYRLFKERLSRLQAER